MPKNNHGQPEQASNGPVNHQQAPLATVTQDYGTMSHFNMSQQPQLAIVDNQQLQSTQTSQTPPIGEPPKPAIRRKTMQQPQQDDQMAMTSETGPQARAQVNQATSANNNIEPKPHNDNQARETTPTFKYLNQQQQREAPMEKANKLSLSLAQQMQHQEDTIEQPEQQLTNQEPQRNYPKKVLFIIANEFCERFSYYGLRTVLVLYFRSVLGFSDSGSTISFHLFATLCYLTPVLGAILGDSILGKYKTILYLSIVYFFGELLLVVASIWWDQDWLSLFLTWAALVMIGVGTGGIKPCVSAFGGDQFLPNETRWRENFFSLFYGAINLGSLISMFLTPMLRTQYQCVGRNDCYPLAFVLPCVLMLVAIFVFLLAHNHYYQTPLPEKNVILAFVQCTWLALKRRLSGHKLPAYQRNPLLAGHTNDATSNSSGSNLSMTSSLENENENEKEKENRANTTNKMARQSQLKSEIIETSPSNRAHHSSSFSMQRRSHWLYLASDRFDANSIEEFRCVLGIFLLFLPTPMFWALFDQQGSLWTLQATRMNGRIWGTNFILEADQMMVANPILLLSSIPLFQLLIYPTLNRCNLLTTPIQKMTTGGFLAALTFVVSALIEFQIQGNMPSELPQVGQASVLFVNGISECSLVEPHLSPTLHNEFALMSSLQPLSSRRVLVPTVNQSQQFAGQFQTQQLQSQAGTYKLTFKLADSKQTDNDQTISQSNAKKTNLTTTTTSTSPIGQGCPFDAKQENELSIGHLNDQAMQLLYIEQGNGKLGYRLFNESLSLPPAGKARVRLLYESFGSYSEALKRQFKLQKDSSKTLKGNSKANPELKFQMKTRDGPVLVSDYLDVDVVASGETFTLQRIEEPSQQSAGQQQQQLPKIRLKPGTRNLLILQQTGATSYQLRHELLQDNDYRISILYQLVPYFMISASEVLFSITGLEFSYSMAPPDLKSLILGAWSLTTAFGNLLTVAIESIQPFQNIGYDFLFYAALMALDIIVFAILGYHYEPYEPALRAQSLRQPVNKQVQ